MLGEFFIIKLRILRLVKENFGNEREKILDVGCGDMPYYQRKVKGKIISVDTRKTKITDVVGDAIKLPFKDNSFDGIVSINSFYYISNLWYSVEEIRRVLRKGGRLFLVVPFIYPIHDVPIDRYRFTEYGLRELFSKGFSIKEIDTIGSIFNLPAVFLHSLIKGIPLMFPKGLRVIVSIFTFILYPFYWSAQLLSLLDFMDMTKRWPTYYYLIANKK